MHIKKGGEMVNFSIVSFLIFFISIVLISFAKFSFAQKTYYTNISCIAREKRALLQFRNSLIDESNRLSSWFGQEEDCCNWEGIRCDKNTGHIVKLDLGSKSIYYQNQGRLQGEINSSLCALKHLNYLDLSMNDFSGIQIPVFLGSLKKLKYLNLSWSGFNGKIPHELGNLSNLQHLDLSWQWELGYLLNTETFSWVIKLSSLQSLDLSSVYFNLSQYPQQNDWIQVITRLPNLRFLKLSLCELSFLSTSIDFFAPLVNKTTLTSLDLRYNYLYSPLPMWLFNMTSLEYLDLEFNYFYGLVPDKISILTSLTYLNLGRNYFEGFLPIEPLCNLNTSLKVLNLMLNRFQGSIPKEIGCFEKLEQLRLNVNDLNGTITSNIGLLSNLKRLDLSYNPMIYGEMSELHFAKMSKLKFLGLEANSFPVNISSSWIPPFQLKYIRISCVPLMGSHHHFPPWLKTQKNLKNLVMVNSSISGEIPNWFKIVNVNSHITILNLRSNNLSGKILDLPFSLNIILLNDNSLKGNIPETICQITNLTILSLYNNQLSGKLPMCFGKLRNLRDLNLKNNSFHGQIPSSLGNIRFLRLLGLSKNMFNGKIPLWIQYLEYMQFLDLGENQFEGNIPSWIGEKLSRLRLLKLQSNLFSGDVPTHICQLSKLQVLNLAGNKLTGYIPQCFNNLSAMISSNGSKLGDFSYEDYFSNGLMWGDFSYEDYYFSEQRHDFMKGRDSRELPKFLDRSNNYFVGEISIHELPKFLDLSNNYFVGEIPNQLMELVELQYLNLSQNQIRGYIPEKIGHLRKIISLDLSMNQLSGLIPQSLRDLNFLNYLNLSSNQLSGRIPTGNQLQVLNDPSIYAGNKGLCGKPLPIACSDEKSRNQENDDEIEEMEFDFSWFYSGLGPGFAVGHLLIFCILLFKKSWRLVFFRFIENLATCVY